MTGLAQEDASVDVTRRSRSNLLSVRIFRAFRRLPLHLTIVIIMAIWLIPTFGLFVNSFRAIEDMTLAQAFEYAQLMLPNMARTGDAKEGFRAFREKRSPTFIGE